MGLLDDPGSGPTLLGLLGAAGAMAPSFQYSRLPQSPVAGLLGGLAGFGQGYLSGQNQITQNAMRDIQLTQMGARLNMMRQFGLLPQGYQPPGGLSSFMGASSPPQAAASSPQVAQAGSAPSATDASAPLVPPSGMTFGAGAPMPSPGATGSNATALSGAPATGGLARDTVRTAVLADMIAPGAGAQIIAKQFPGPTDAQRAVAAAGIDPASPQGHSLLGLAAAKAAGIDVAPNVRAGSAALVWNPDAGRYEVAFKNPVLPEGMDYEPDPNGGPGHAYQVPGAFQGMATIEGIKQGAELTKEQLLSHYMAGLKQTKWEERDPTTGQIVEKQGTGLDFLNALNSGAVTNGPQNPAGSAAPSSSASATPSSSLTIPVGGSEKQTEVAKVTGAQAANSAQVKSITQALNAAIDRALAINDKVPSGSFGIAEAKADLSNLPLVGNGQDAKYAALYKQEIGSNILSGLQQLRGLGRLDIPEVNQVMQTYGIGIENKPEARAAALKNLRQIINNNAAVSQNTVANLNTPGLANSTARAPITNTPVTGEKAPASKSIDTATRTAAQNAIMHGASRAAVIKRLQDNGYDTSGF